MSIVDGGIQRCGKSLRSSDDMILFVGLCSMKRSLVILNHSKIQCQSWCLFYWQCAFERIESGIKSHDQLWFSLQFLASQWFQIRSTCWCLHLRYHLKDVKSTSNHHHYQQQQLHVLLRLFCHRANQQKQKEWSQKGRRIEARFGAPKFAEMIK